MLSACQLIKRGAYIDSLGVSLGRVIRRMNQPVIYACSSLASIASRYCLLLIAYSSGYVTAASDAVTSPLIMISTEQALSCPEASIDQPS
jgi:hypothetical protein